MAMITLFPEKSFQNLHHNSFIQFIKVSSYHYTLSSTSGVQDEKRNLEGLIQLSEIAVKCAGYGPHIV